jgi:hypothetical protein
MVRTSKLVCGRWRVAVACAAAAVAVAGAIRCGVTVAGSSQNSAGGAGFAPVNVAALDTGAYPVIVPPAFGRAGSSSRGRVLDGQRMADDVVAPYEVDPALLRAIPQNTMTLDSFRDLPEPLADAAAAHGFIVGFSTARKSVSPGGMTLIGMVLRFSDPAAAVASAAQMAIRTVADQPQSSEAVVSIPRHPNAIASRFDAGTGAVVTSFSPHGAYVLYECAQSQQGIDTAVALIAKTLDLQEPRIRQFVPTDPTKFADILADPSRLLARTLPLNPNALWSNGATVYRSRAALHFQDDPAASAAVFAAAGVDAVSVSRSRVYQAADAAGAARVADMLARAARGNSYRPAATVQGLPTSQCFDGGHDSGTSPRRFYCVAVADRDAFEVFSDQQRDVQQQSAAQYRLLVGH